MNKKKIGLFVVALCLYLGFSMDVFAANYIVDKAPDTFTTRMTGRTLDRDTNTLKDMDKFDAIMANGSINAVPNTAQVIDYHSTDGLKLFCTDRKVQYGQGQVYKKTENKVDYGIAYIIANSEAYYNVIEGSATAAYKDLEQAWLTQMAIWQYQDAEFGKINVNNPEMVEGNAPSYVYSTSTTVLWAAASHLAKAAKSAKNPEDVNSFALKFDGNYTLVEDQKSIKTGLIGLQSTSNITTYSLDISKAPNGTKVYNQSGQEVSNLKAIPAATKVYLMIPIDNVESYTFDFDLTGSTDNYKYYKGYEYTSGDFQPLTLVVPTTKNLSAKITLKGSKVPDTASSISNSIYFIGLIILLGGVGIIYANTRTKQEEI